MMDDYEEMTPEEIELERRARRRRREARERKRKRRMRRIITRISILVLILVLILIGIIKMITGIWKHFHDKPKEQTAQTTEEVIATTEEIHADIPEEILAKELPADRETALAMLKEQGESDSDIHAVYENAAVYPDSILMHLAVNSELKQYAVNFPAKINTVFDGDFSVAVTDQEVPLYLQYDERWGYADYGSSVIAITGCAPCCLSMAYTWLMKDGSMNPIRVADFSMEKGYMGENNETFWTLMTEGAVELGLTSEELSISKERMVEALEDGKLIICSMESGDFTKKGSFLLICGYENGLFYVHDPASEARSKVGWDYKRLESQICNMWAVGAGSSAGGNDTEGGQMEDQDIGDGQTEGQDAGDSQTEGQDTGDVQTEGQDIGDSQTEGQDTGDE